MRYQKMKSEFSNIFNSIEKELEYQDKKWGKEFDSKNTINDWVCYIIKYAGDAAFQNVQIESYRKLLKVAALAVAAMTSYEINNGFPLRHYDKEN